MEPIDIIEIAKDSIWVLLKTSSIIIIPGMIVGLIVSLFQALTQIQEVTLTFVPKVMVIMMCLLFFSDFIGDNIMQFTERIFANIITS